MHDEKAKWILNNFVLGQTIVLTIFSFSTGFIYFLTGFSYFLTIYFLIFQKIFIWEEKHVEIM